jgi:DNA polymerase I-like protein with 3'-5' exonuclease and polymerase domains
MRLVQLGDTRQGWAFPPGWAGAAVEIANLAPHLAMHNRPYDQRVLKQHAPGWRQRWEVTEDTLPAGHICDSGKLAGLKPRSVIEVDPRAMRGEAVLKEGMAANKWTWDTVPDDWDPYWAYGAVDPVLTAHLWEKFAPTVTGPQREAYDLEKAVTRISAAMMDAGMMVDIPFIEDAMRRVGAYRTRAMEYLTAVHGIHTVNSGEQVMRGLNAAGIPTQVWTAEGKPSIAKDALAFYKANYPQHRDLIQCIQWARKAGDIIGKYLQKFLDLQIDGTMHYTINTCKARTSRESVTDPPMQTFDRDEPVIRGAFRPRPGHVFISIDADQIEMRLTAHLSQDRNLIQDFLDADASGQSFFVLAASRIYGEEVSKKDPRYSWTKNASYAQVYGSGLENAAVTAGVPVSQMRGPYYGFQQRYPGVAARMSQHIRRGKSGGRPYATAIDGRKLYVNRGKEYAILNTEMQGSAAVILKRGLIDLDAAGLGEYLRLDIHDEHLLEVPSELAEEVLRTAENILTNRTDFAVPITWSGKILEKRWVKA